MPMTALQTAALLTYADANPSLSQIMAGTALDFTRAGLTALIRLATAVGMTLDGTAPALPRPRMTDEEWILGIISAA